MRIVLSLLLAILPGAPALRPATLTGEVVDAATGRPIPARVYIQGKPGEWFFASSATPEGSAVRYDRQSSFNKLAVERHTTLSAHPFTAELAPGSYEITVERGKEYRPLSRKLEVASEPVKLRLELERWVDMASRGWFSGDTHVHRDPAELPNVMLAEDVNVAHPMVYWTTSDDVAPGASTRNFKGDFPAGPVAVDATHVYYPRNTEYEIFTTRKTQHTLGAVLILGHKSAFEVPVLPVSRVAERARSEGALLDLEKHNWPWSMPIVPLMNIDLYELSNNHFWRVEYSVKDWADPAPPWMGLSGTGSGNERDWALYGFLNYYALVDCGFRLRPTAGTANGVHPVPLGFGRVYVHLDGDFGYDAWMKALNEGRSFVTTGPMLLCTVDGRMPGHRFALGPGETHAAKVEMTSIAMEPDVEIEVIVNGVVARKLKPSASKDARGAFQAAATEQMEIKDSSWIAVRCWQEAPNGRVRFAHTAPFYFDRPGSPLRPRREEARFLADRVRGEIARSSKLIPPDAVAEYERALKVFEAIEATAR